MFDLSPYFQILIRTIIVKFIQLFMPIFQAIGGFAITGKNHKAKNHKANW